MEPEDLTTKDLKIISWALSRAQENLRSIEAEDPDNDVEWMGNLSRVVEHLIKKKEVHETEKDDVTVLVEDGVVIGVHGLRPSQQYRILDEDAGVEPADTEACAAICVEGGVVTDFVGLEDDQRFILYDLDQE